MSNHRVDNVLHAASKQTMQLAGAVAQVVLEMQEVARQEHVLRFLQLGGWCGELGPFGPAPRRPGQLLSSCPEQPGSPAASW